MLRIVHAIVTGLIGAALLHLVIVLALPRFSERDTFSRVLALGPAGTFHRLAKGGEAGSLSPRDPFMRVSTCAFSLKDGAIAAVAAGSPEFWSFAAFDKAGNEVFSINDRSLDGKGLDAVIATPSQAAQLRKADPDMTEQRILVEFRGMEGYLVLRSAVPHASMEPEALAFLDGARCNAYRPQ